MKQEKGELRKELYETLRGEVFSGKLKQGDRLVETCLAEKYQINKSHIHAVLQMLQSDGLLDYLPMRGFSVIGITHADLFEIAKIREMLESAIFEDFLKNAGQPDIDEAKRLTQRKIAFLRAGLKDDAFKETNAFFDKIYTCTSYHRMVAMLKLYRDYINIMIIKAFDRPDDIAKTIANSTLLYEVLEKRDLSLAQEWIRIRYDNIVDKIEQTTAF